MPCIWCEWENVVKELKFWNNKKFKLFFCLKKGRKKKGTVYSCLYGKVFSTQGTIPQTCTEDSGNSISYYNLDAWSNIKNLLDYVRLMFLTHLD